MLPCARATIAVCLLSCVLATRGEANTIQVAAGDDLQRAIDSAQPGDVLLLQAGATFTGNFVLPVKAGATYITIRSAASDADLPPAGTRIGPKWASKLPKLRSGNDAAAVRTAPGAHHWRLLFIEFLANQDGYSDIIQLGDGSSAQTALGQVPTDLHVDRVYVHGDPGTAQKRGIALNAARVTIESSYISDCKAVGADAQAIAGWNGPGPYTIDNNYLEGAAENFLLGGSDPAINGLIASDVVFRRNYLSKPVAWRDPIIATPSGLSAVAGTGGTLPAGAVSYVVTARRPVGLGTIGRSTGATVSATAAGGGVIGLQWTAVAGAMDYQVFARGFVWTTTATSFTDTGAAGTVATAPSGPGSTWTIKNVFELKNARRVTAQYNIFESNWQAGQAGYAIVFTPRNSGGACSWCTIDDVEFSFNIVRHSAAGINVLGHDSPEVSGVATNIRIRHNLFYDINHTRWSGNGWFMLIGDGARQILVDHNTIDHDGSSVVYVYGGTATNPTINPGFVYTNNLSRHNAYGLSGAFFSYGLAILNGFFPNATVTGNLLSGGTASRYPAGNFFNADFDAQFVGPGGDYRLVSSSAALGRATDGQNIGADVATIVAQTARVGAGQTVIAGAPRTPLGLRLIVR